MKKTKHHYIPKLILRNFAENDKIFIYRNENEKIFQSSINDAFAINNLNTIVDNEYNVDSNLLEDLFDKYFENPAAITIEKIINDLKKIPPSGKNFTVEDYVCLLEFTLLSHFRTPFSLDSVHHAALISLYGLMIVKHFNEYGNVNMSNDFQVEKGFRYNFLEDFNGFTKTISDLKLTLYYHRQPNLYFLIPDQLVVIQSPNNIKFSDKDLKIYFPISSNVVICLERIEREFQKGTCEIDKVGVERFNGYFLKNFYESVGCQSKDYLESFIENYQNEISPLEKYNPYSNFEKEKQQIKLEVISKLALNFGNDNYENGFIAHVDKNHNFKILSESEFEKVKREMNSIKEIKNKKFNIK